MTGPRTDIPLAVVIHITRNALAKEFPKRWEHSQGVAMKAAYLADRLPLTSHEKELLVNAAWMHDIGYAYNRGFNWHPLDGAVTLRRWEMPEIASLIAWHSTAQEEAEIIGLSLALSSYPHPTGLVPDALTYADMTVGSAGQPLTPDERLTDVVKSHGRNSPQATAIHAAWDRLGDVFTRVDAALL